MKTGFMDKIKPLRYLSNSDFFPLLSNGEVKLYLLLLINASAVDTIEKISLKQIKKAEGKMPSPSELKAIMTSLERYGLAVMERVTEWPTGKLVFRLKRPVKCVTGVNKKGRGRKNDRKTNMSKL